VSRGARPYRVLLRLYPEAFRERHGTEMTRLFTERLADARGPLARVGCWAGAVADVVVNGLGERRVAFLESIRGGGGMDGWTMDLRYAVRTLFRNPGFALVAVVTIGLGIGANTAIFSVIQNVVLAPLPYDDPDELVVLWGEMRNRDVLYFPTSPPDFDDYRRQADLLDDLAGVATFPQSITGDGEPEQVDVAGVTYNFFDLLGVEPLLGRGFTEEDATPNDPNAQPGAANQLPFAVMLGHALWQQRYGGDQSVVGRTIQVGGGPAVVVGVLPPDFELLMPPEGGLAPPDLYGVMRLDYANAPRNNVFLRLVGRLRDGATIPQAQAQIDGIAASLAADDQVKSSAGYAMRVESLHRGLTAQVRPVLYALFGAVVFVLLIACANVSNLLLARSSVRGQEMAVRAALGGSRPRLVRQLLLESGVLALLGAAVGLVLAAGGVRLLVGLHPDNLPRLDAVGLDTTVLGFTLLAAAGSAVMFGLLPALQTARSALADALKERGQAGAGTGRRLLRNGVVVMEVALSMVLLIGAGLMARSFVALNQVQPGYEPEGLLAFDVSVPFASYPTPTDRANLSAEIQRRLSAIPGVTSAATGYPFPLSPVPSSGRYGPEEALTDPSAFRQAVYRSVGPGYFETMGTRLLGGRTFTEADMADAEPIVVVDEKLARSLWPGQSAVGKRFLVRATSTEPEWVEVIGVVEHQRSESLAAEGMEAVYYSNSFLGGFSPGWLVRTTLDPLSLVPAVRAELSAVDPDLPMASVRLFADDVERAMGPTRFALTLIGVFGIVALVLASVGLYGVLSYLVRQRTAEIGVRLAFGAESARILRMVVGQGLVLAAAGVGLGLVGAVPLTGAMRSLLVGVAPVDVPTFAGISAIFLAVAALACWVPARRAAHLDPVAALRKE